MLCMANDRQLPIGKKESSEKICRVAKAVGIVGNPLHDSITLREAQRSYKAADAKYREMKPHAPMMREEFLRERTKDTSLPEIARKRAKQQLGHERQRDNARRMKHIWGKWRAGAISKVGIGEGEEYQEYEDQATVERLIIENNAAHFWLTEDTPPMSEPLLSDLGYLADTSAAEEILQGTYVCPPGTDEYTQDFLQFLQRSPNVNALDQIDTSFTREDFRAYWKKSNERTSSSISTLHFGHYKTAIKNDKLSELHAVSIDIALNSGYSLKRWQKGLTVMLEKKKGVIKVNKLRAILLMEGDLNCANKTIFGKRMMEFAEERNEIPEECVGSRRNHQASDVSLNRRLFCDIARQKKCSAAICCVDLEQCYDRIAHSIASLGARRWGVPQLAITCLLTTVQLMLFFLRTAHGDSDSFYSASTDQAAQNEGNIHPYQGTCQGNGAGPSLFLGVSAPCVLYMHGKGFAAHLVSAFSTAIFSIVGILYVDDTDLLAIASYPSESAEQVSIRMQDMVNHWRGCLRVTGGNLNPDKCNGTMIGFYWDEDGQWHYRNDIEATITIPDSEGTMQAIEMLGPSNATTVVGVAQAVDGNMTAQVQKLKEDADDVGDRIKKGYLPRRLIWQTLRTMVWPSISYPLSSTTITEEESYEITKSLYFQILPSGGANQNFPTPYRHAPYAFFGLSLPRAIDTEFLGQIKSMLTHGAIPTHTGRFLNISLEQAQLEVGIGTPILEADYEQYGFLLTFCWIKVLWKRLWEYDIVLHQPEAEKVLPKLQREGDFFIMERIVQSQGFTEEAMIRMNRCRLAFRALTIADVLSGDGTKVTQEAKSIQRLNRPPSLWDWPNERPCSRDISKWKLGLKRITSQNFSLPFDIKLGRWIQPSHLKWQWFYWRSERKLFRRVNNLWHQWELFSPRSTVAFKRVAIIPTLPVPLEQLERATTREVGERMMLEGAAGNEYPVDPTYANIHEFIEDWEDSWPIADSYFPPDPTLVAQAISNGTAVMVSDGSYKALLSTEIGAAAWILECSQTGATCCGECSTSGLRSEVNAYRSELQGCHAGLLGLMAFAIYHQLHGGSVTFHFDNDAGVDKSAESYLNVPTRYKHADLVKAIRVIVYRLKTEHEIQVTFEKVQGHRLRHVRYEQLTRPEQLNEMMDGRAKARVDRIFAQRIPPPPMTIKFEGWSCWIDNTKSTSDPSKPLLRRIHEDTMRDWLSRPDHLRMTAAGFDLVDWQAVELAAEGFPEMFRIWASKHMSRFCGVGRMQQICGFWDNSQCPRCKQDNETTTHVLICPDNAADLEWRCRVANLGIWLLEVDTHPAIKKCIMESLSSRSTTTLFSPHATQVCLAAAMEQDEIGWQNFVEGKISKSWGNLQWQHYQEQLLVRSGDKWSAGLVTQLLELTHGMWIHRNNILHAVDAQGLPLRQAAELEASIHLEFCKGTEGLARRDHHFIRRGRDDVLSLSASDKQGWLRGIQLARESQVTAPPVHQQQQQLMMDFFQMSDD